MPPGPRASSQVPRSEIFQGLRINIRSTRLFSNRKKVYIYIYTCIYIYIYVYVYFLGFMVISRSPETQQIQKYATEQPRVMHGPKSLLVSF